MPGTEELAEIARTRRGALAEAARMSREPVASVTDLDADGVPCRLFVPSGARTAITYLHGGGFVYGEPDTHDAYCRRLANRTEQAVLFVHYRRAPEDHYPAAVDDARAATDWWTAIGCPDRGLDPARQVLLGDSAGANLALGLALRERARYAAMVLVYPFLDPAGGSYATDLPDPELDAEACTWFWELYAPDRSRWSEVALDPLLSPDFTGLPPTLIQLAELDVLTPTGLAVAAALTAAGVPTRTRTYPGVPHGFWRHSEYPAAAEALAHLDAFLRQFP